MRIQAGRPIAAVSIVLIVAGLWVTVRGQVAPPKKSDAFAVTENGRHIRVQQGELPTGNFQIAGVNLARDQDVLEQAARILGRAKTTATGDASTFQKTACYRSADADDPTVLLFSNGEVDYSFELTSNHALANKARCLPSPKIIRSLATGSGLRLGETPAHVIALLGLPTRRTRNNALDRTVLVYDFETKKKTAPRDFVKMREKHPDMTEHDLDVNFGSYSLEETMQATFESGSLLDLRVDWSAQN